MPVDVMAEHQLGDLRWLLRAAAFQGLAGSLGDGGEGECRDGGGNQSSPDGFHPLVPAKAGTQILDSDRRLDSRLRGNERSRGGGCHPLRRSMAAPQPASLSSSRSKPRSRW